MPRALTRKTLIYACKKIRESPYHPKVWVGRASTMISLGYSELAVADAYKAWLLTDVLMNYQTVKTDGGKLYDKVYSTIAKDIPQLKHLLRQDFHRSMPKMLILREVVWTYRKQAILMMATALSAIRAGHDSICVLEDALKLSPGNKVFAHLLAVNTKRMEERKLVFKSRGMDDVTMAKAVKRGRVNRVAYPWIVPEELARSTKAVKRLKAKFKDASANAIIAASSVGGISKDNYGVFAKNDIYKGQRILLDETIFCNYNILGGNYCEACCERLVAGGITVACCQAKYCSEDCKSKALSNYHKTICDQDFSWLYDDCKDADFSFNDAIPLVMLKLLATAVQQDLKPLSLPCVATLTANLNSDKVSFFRLQHNVTTPLKILQTLGVDIFANSRFDSWVTQTLFMRIENNMQGHTFGKRTSIGVNPYFSMFNHDCNPSAKWGGRNGLLSVGGPINVSAVRDIKANEEIKVSYVERNLPEEHRREKLKLQLGMICLCERCLRGRSGEKKIDQDIVDMMMEEYDPAEFKEALDIIGLGADAGKAPDLTVLMEMMGLHPDSSSEPDLASMMSLMGLGAASGSKPDLANMMDMMRSGLGSGRAPDMTNIMEMMGLNPASGQKQT